MNKTVVEISRVFPHKKNTPYTVKVHVSTNTVLSLIFLNKLWIPDVLIDLIKDYLFISKEEYLRQFFKNSINKSFKRLSIDRNFLVDIYGRRRQSQVLWKEKNEGLQFQQFICVTCGENSEYHEAHRGCCAMEMDDVEDGFLALEVERTDDEVPVEAVMETVMEEVVDEEEEEEEFVEDYSYPYEQDDYDRFEEDNWYAGDRYAEHDRAYRH